MGVPMSSRSQFSFLRAVIYLAAPILFGCAVGPNYDLPNTEVPAEFKGSGSAPQTSAVDLERWWETFQDPALDGLVRAAVQSNLDLKVAEARVREARATLRISQSGLLPQANTGLSGNRNKNSANLAQGQGRAPTATTGGATGDETDPNQPGTGNLGALQQSPGSTANLFRTGFDMSWELDIFGGVRREVEAAEYSLEAQEEARRGALITLLSEVALNYVQLRGSQFQMNIAQKNVAIEQDTLDLQKTRFEAGIASDLNVAQVEAQLATVRAQIPNLETQIQQSIHRLGVLLGREPNSLEAELIAPKELPKGPAEIPPGLPSELLRRRPDIRQSERQLAIATANIGVAVSDLYPKFNLTGSLGLQSRQSNSLLDAGSLFWSAGPAANWQILNFFGVLANINLQNERQSQALFQYQQSILTALEEVENALVSYSQEQKRRAHLQEAVKANRRSLELARHLNDAGLVEFLNVLEAEQSLFEAERQLSVSDQTVSTNLIALYKSLGGGWAVAEAEFASEAPVDSSKLTPEATPSGSHSPQ